MSSAHDELDDLLADAPLVLDDDVGGADDLDRLVAKPAPARLEVSTADLDDLTNTGMDVSYVTEHSSSKLDREGGKLSFRQLAKLDLSKYPARIAKRLLSGADACKPTANPVDRLDESAIINLLAALEQAEARVLEGDEVALIIAPGKPTGTAMPADRRLALHLNATPVDGVVIINLDIDTTTLRRSLLLRGIKQGRDYEIIEAASLLPFERAVFNRFLTSKRGSKLRILRRLSKTRASTL